jgi:hypothetical protein
VIFDTRGTCYKDDEKVDEKKGSNLTRWLPQKTRVFVGWKMREQGGDE